MQLFEEKKMNQASLYAHVNEVQRINSKKFLDEFAKLIQWRTDGCDSLIDIGSGTGDVLMDYVYPLLSPNFKELVFSDISENMLNYARKRYASHERTEFKILDIMTDVLPKQLSESFDHVTSFFCLHWVDNQLKALKNIYQLLRPEGGDCLHFVLASFFVYDCFESLAKDKKWSNYMQDYKRFISPLQYCEDPAAKFEQLLQQAGFVHCEVENLKFEYIFGSRLYFSNFLKSVIPFFERIPAEQNEEFFEDIVDIAKNMNLCHFIEDSDDYKVVTSYAMVKAYGRKPVGNLKKGSSKLQLVSNDEVVEQGGDVARR